MGFRELVALKIKNYVVERDAKEYLRNNLKNRHGEKGVTASYVNQLLTGDGLSYKKVDEICALFELEPRFFIDPKGLSNDNKL